MKLLLDENLPHDLRFLLEDHDVFTVVYMGWNGVKNGRLLLLAAADGFDALLTLDDGIAYQTNLQMLPAAVVVINARSNKIEDLEPLIPQLLESLNRLSAKTIARVGPTES